MTQLRTPTLAVRVQLMLAWNTYLVFNTDIVNFAVKTNAESTVLLIFLLWRSLHRRWMRGGGVGQKSYLGPTEIVSFSSRILAEAKNMTYSDMLYRLDISTFCFYESLLFQIFFLWKFIKTSVFPCLLSLLQSTATQITFSINIFICFKYYTV